MVSVGNIRVTKCSDGTAAGTNLLKDVWAGANGSFPAFFTRFGNKLLFRDKRRQLHLYNIKEQKKQTLLNYCKFVSWVPNSDVVVAQNRNNLCVWYSIEEADKVTMY